MEPVTIFMLTNTIAGIVASLGKLLHDARNNDKMLEGCEKDLASFKAVIDQVEAVLEEQAIRDMISHTSADSVFARVVESFQDCHRFLDELSQSIVRSKSKKTRALRFVNAKYRNEDRLGLQQQLAERTRNAQIGLEIITLQATCRIPDYVQESKSEIVKHIKVLENMLRNYFTLSNSDHPSSSTTSESTALINARSATPLENAARETISQAMIIWKEQRDPRSGSIHTVETQPNRDDSPLDSPWADASDRPVIIAVCGMTGSGKSSFISAVAGTDIGIGHGLHSETNTVNEVRTTFEGRQITLVDTPGFADTEISDTDVLKMIADWMETSYKDNTLLSGIIYLHQIHHNRVEGPSLRNIHLFEKLCGEGGLQNVILATTMWDTAKTAEDQKTFELREEELTQTFWARMISRDSKVRRHYHTRESALDLISEFMDHKAAALDIQTELVDEHKPLGETTAGSYVDDGLQKMLQKHQTELDDLLQMMESSNESARHEIAQEYEKVLNRMRATEEETRFLHEQGLDEISRQRNEEACARADDARAYDKKLKDMQKSFAADMKESAKQTDRQARTYEKELKRVQETSSREQSELARRYERDMSRLEKNLEASSSREKAMLAKQLEDQFSRQLHETQVSANKRITKLTEQVDRMRYTDASKDDKIENLMHQLRAVQDSNNNNNINSGNSRSYHNHLSPVSSGGGGGSSGGSIPPPPPPPKLLKVPTPTKHWLARGMAEKAENERRMREHEKHLDAYYRKYGS